MGTHFFIPFSDLFDQCLGLLTVFLLNGLVELFSQVDDLAMGLDLSLIVTNDSDEISCLRFMPFALVALIGMAVFIAAYRGGV